MMTDDQIVRFTRLEGAVISYLSHLWAYEQGSEQDGKLVDFWRDQMSELVDEHRLNDWKDTLHTLMEEERHG